MVDDKTLILEFLDGNVESFNTLILQHEGWVHGMILQVVRHKEDTEDLCQDIFVKVYFKLKRFRFESTFKTWLYRIVINSINNYLRKQKLLTWFGQDLKEELAIEEHDNSIKKDTIYKMTNKLPNKQRNIVLLRIYQDLPFKTIGNILSISENSAKVSFYKAKENLKEYSKISYAK